MHAQWPNDPRHRVMWAFYRLAEVVLLKRRSYHAGLGAVGPTGSG